MRNQKQQVISRFFAPKPKSSIAASESRSSQPQTPPPRIAATVAFSPVKRLRTSELRSTVLKHDDVSSQGEAFIPLPEPTLHQKFLDKLLEPSEDTLDDCLINKSCSTQIPKRKYTPLEKQVCELKERYPDVLLMIEVGYKYRFFGKDAEIAARVLGIYAHMDHNFLTASIPTFRLNVHVRRLVNAGYKVGVVKQTEAAAIKAHGLNKSGPFGRGLSALYTKGTLEAAEDLGGQEEEFGSCCNYLFCVVERDIKSTDGGVDVRIGAVAAEISAGDTVYDEFDDNFLRCRLEAMLLSFSPAELLLVEPLSRQTKKLLLAYAGPASNVRVEHISRDCFKYGGALAEVISLYENIEKSIFENSNSNQGTQAETRGKSQTGVEVIMDLPELVVQALAFITRHLQQFGLQRILCLGALFRPFSGIKEMTLSANALKQLEVLKNNLDGDSGSLLKCMDHTLTVFGARQFRHWIAHPLCDRNMIYARSHAVSELLDGMNSSKSGVIALTDACLDTEIRKQEIHHVLSCVLTTLGQTSDVQRGITRIFHGTATTKEFVSVIQSILVAGRQIEKLCKFDDEKKTSQVKSVHSLLLRKLLLTASSPEIIDAASSLLSKINTEAAEKQDLNNLFVVSDGNFVEVSSAWIKVHSANQMLDELLPLIRKRLRMHSLEYSTVSGITHLIELPLNAKVPSDWVKVNSTVRAIRYHPPDVLNALDQLALANAELSVVCQAAWDTFLKTFCGFYPEFQAVVHALATLDCLHSLAVLARNKHYVLPAFVPDDEPVQMIISAGRHPVMEDVLQHNFVPNDTNLHGDEQCCQVITGPNMGGKSCYIRQVALITLMAQMGSFVPASSAKLHVVDGIYTRMGASDNIHHGRSTFLEEMSETSEILKHSTSQSLVIIDELGRGTSTHDGTAIAYATLHYLLEHKRCMVLFVTHYPEILSIRNEFPGRVGAFCVSYLTSVAEANIPESESDQYMKNIVKNEDVTYLYKLIPGVSKRSFAFKVAQLAQLPLSCINRGIEMSMRLEREVQTRKKSKLEAPFEDIEDMEKAYRKIFLYLNSALSEEVDDAERLRCLKLTKNLINFS